jgi:hypothetical protein
MARDFFFSRESAPRVPGHVVGLGRENRVPNWAVSAGPYDGGRSS